MNTHPLIHPHHAIRASRFLLSIDISAIPQSDKPYIRDEVRTLIQVTTQLHPHPLHHTHRQNQSTYRDLCTLAHLVNHLAQHALTEEARACLTHFIYQH